ncbi:hypothetical protein ACFFJY_02800 [Fictibacillus aquaticus]|uniref:Uncharacterized protein n=1 Tax=Fictibacillus aquaticus TaxID=2021314 RepID=A0A235F8Y5_9BACL|nr:hypothetical protein [Fictibacillus aquaticus]OYD57629.1 hypothetical protein CGZ90_13265 [Fictibacillus aquaticus]
MKEIFGGRKLIATFFSSLIFSMYGGFASAWNNGHPGYSFLAFTFMIIMYAGAIIFVYGNLASLVVEVLLIFWEKKNKLRVAVYILLHGVFGALPALYVKNAGFILLGVPVAILYAVIDLWVKDRFDKGKRIVLLPAIVFGSFALITLTLGLFGNAINNAIDPFTAEDAIEYVIYEPDNTLGSFPKEDKVVTENVSGYVITRETSIKKTGDYSYIITLKENWTKGELSGSWTAKYDVERGSSWVIHRDLHEPLFSKE